MSVSKDPKRGIYYVQCRYKDWTGESKKKTKRGFKTEKEARNWEYEFLKCMEGAPTMLFSEFYEVYAEDTKMRLRQTMRETKANMIENKILPFLGHKRVNEITALDILNWDNELMAMRTGNGLEYLPALDLQSALRYNQPCRPLLRARIESHGEGRQDRQQAG